MEAAGYHYNRFRGFFAPGFAGNLCNVSYETVVSCLVGFVIIVEKPEIRGKV